jgi:hypothetical protein
MYVASRTSRTIKVVEATVMPSCILHGWPIPADYVVVKVTMIREGHEFEDLAILMKRSGLSETG